ncbi:DUF4767 domain-containing protein [Companilactobacillus mishanensis]|uniref:DUF4767 domain-containing protein n=1 Tax=Companilactobacillus mishanensis TaxID=2486008 RepID=UPI0030B84652
MKIKNVRLLIVLAFGVFLLVGCSNSTKSVPVQNGTSAKKSSNDTTTTTSSPKKSSTLWDNKKDSKLSSFMSQWGPTMNQSYTKYDGKHSLDTSTGIKYPDDLNKVTVNGSNASIGWSKTGKGNNEYNVVAIYNYVGTVPPLPSHITYFFAFHNGKPVALVDQTRDGNPRLVTTSNNKVKTSFASIADGKSVGNVTGSTSNNSSKQSSSSSKSSNEDVSDPKMIGVMVHQLTMPDDDIEKEPMLGVYTHNDKYWIGIGTSVSTVGYSIDGDNVHYYVRPYGSTTPTYKQERIEHTISKKKLIDKYYSTPAQKQVVQDVANRMPAIDGD